MPEQKSQTNLVNTQCAICETDRFDAQIYPANFDPVQLNYETFSARRLPDRVHFRIVKCGSCGLVRANPVLDEGTLSRLYSGSHFEYEKESGFAAETYWSYFQKALKYSTAPLEEIRLLEIGCGNGFFLNKIKEQGIKDFYGIEPSVEAVERSGKIREKISVGMFKAGVFTDNSFDFICGFQLFDHIGKPNEFLKACHACLKKEGVFFLINHNAGSWAAKLLGKRCPMIDVEHPFLYDFQTHRKILQKHQFEVLSIFNVANRYPVLYWLKLAPLPRSLKSRLLNLAQKSSWGDIPINMSLGNMAVIARKTGRQF